MPKLEDYLKIIGDDRFEITEIRAEEECIVILDELKSIIIKSSEIEAHPICNEEQKYCVCCILEGKVVASDLIYVNDNAYPYKIYKENFFLF